MAGPGARAGATRCVRPAARSKAWALVSHSRATGPTA
jgi:hypothetical protein